MLFFWAAVTPLQAITIEGRLPGEYFREDNPPRFGAVTSYVSTGDSLVVLHATHVDAGYTIAKELQKIAKGFKIGPQALERQGITEGSMRWLQYSFRKKAGGGFVYITRYENWIVYLMLFNLKYELLANDLPYIERYVRQLEIKDEK